MYPVLHVVTCISNPKMFERRYELYRQFRSRMEATPGIVLHTVEMAFGERAHQITSKECPNDIQVRGDTELWHKENLLNIGFSRLPDDWKYACWVDADIMFANPNWVQDTIDQLQHYSVVQMFSTIYDMDPQYDLNHGVAHGYVYNWFQRGRKHYNVSEKSYTQVGAPGYAWAFTRKAFETLGGLYQFGILGSGDYYMANAMTGNIIVELEEHNLHPNYIKSAYDWRENALKLKSNIGFVSGTIMHYWHGPRVNRGYGWRNKILVEHQYDPTTDLKVASNGLLILNDNKPGLRDAIRGYFRQRDENSIYTGKDKLLP